MTGTDNVISDILSQSKRHTNADVPIPYLEDMATAQENEVILHGMCFSPTARFDAMYLRHFDYIVFRR